MLSPEQASQLAAHFVQFLFQNINKLIIVGVVPGILNDMTGMSDRFFPFGKKEVRPH